MSLQVQETNLRDELVMGWERDGPKWWWNNLPDSKEQRILYTMSPARRAHFCSEIRLNHSNASRSDSSRIWWNCVLRDISEKSHLNRWWFVNVHAKTLSLSKDPDSSASAMFWISESATTAARRLLKAELPLSMASFYQLHERATYQIIYHCIPTTVRTPISANVTPHPSISPPPPVVSRRLPWPPSSPFANLLTWQANTSHATAKDVESRRAKAYDKLNIMPFVHQP